MLMRLFRGGANLWQHRGRSECMRMHRIRSFELARRCCAMTAESLPAVMWRMLHTGLQSVQSELLSARLWLPGISVLWRSVFLWPVNLRPVVPVGSFSRSLIRRWMCCSTIRISLTSAAHSESPCVSCCHELFDSEAWSLPASRVNPCSGKRQFGHLRYRLSDNRCPTRFNFCRPRENATVPALNRHQAQSRWRLQQGAAAAVLR